MVTQQHVQQQLNRLGVSFRFLGRPESKELANILTPDEIIHHAIITAHNGVFVLVCATDRRILVIDKRPMFLNIEDIRYEMIMEVDYAGRLLDASLFLHTTNKKLQLQTIRQDRLRALRNFIQEQIMALRQNMMYDPLQHLTQGWSRSVRTAAPLLMRRRVAKYPSSIRP